MTKSENMIGIQPVKPSDSRQDMNMDRTLRVPLYYQLKELILAQIEGGHLRYGQAIPCERELCERYRVSRTTVRQAIGELEREGYLNRQQGKGTFVARPRIRRGMAQLTSFSEEVAASGHEPGSQLLALRHEPADSRVASALGLEEGVWVWFVERLRLADDEPIGINLSYLRLPSDVFLVPAELEAEVSLWSLLEAKGIRLVEAEETILAIVADARQAELLGVPEQSPLLVKEGVVYSDERVPVEFHRVIARADRYSYSVHVFR